MLVYMKLVIILALIVVIILVIILVYELPATILLLSPTTSFAIAENKDVGTSRSACGEANSFNCPLSNTITLKRHARKSHQ